MNCAIIGFGGLGKLHFGNVSKMDDVTLIALCDVEASRFTEKTATNLGADDTSKDLSRYNLYTDYKELLAKETLDFVIVATPTYTHAGITIDALDAGVNAFCEKPMARHKAECQAMLDAAAKSGKKLMIGQCLRFWPEYVYLKEKIENGEFGKVIRADFARQSSTPIWGWENWFMDFDKCGGAALDMHVHDVDMIHWLFSPPQSVMSSATHVASRFDAISTNYVYGDKIVTAVCDWGMAAKFGFRMTFIVRFEKAVVEMTPQSFFVHTDDETFTPELPKRDAYYEEIREFIVCISEGRQSAANPPESSFGSLKLALAEMEAAEKGGELSV